MSGVAAIQTFLYYRSYPKDHISLKGLIVFVGFVPDSYTEATPTFHNNVGCQLTRSCSSHLHHAIHLLLHGNTLGCVRAGRIQMNSSFLISFYLIFCLGDHIVLNRFTWSWGFMLLFDTLIISTCQFFLTFRFKVISDGNWWMTSVLAFFALIPFGCGLTSAAQAFQTKSVGALTGA